MPARSKPVDPDNPPLTDEQLRRMRPAREVLPKHVLDRHGRDRQAALASGNHPPIPPADKDGRSKLDTPRRAVSIRLDPDVIDTLKATGAGWQARANELLRKGLKLKALR